MRFGVDVLEEIVVGCTVVRHERFRPQGGQSAIDAGLQVYQVEGDLIRRVWYTHP